MAPTSSFLVSLFTTVAGAIADGADRAQVDALFLRVLALIYLCAFVSFGVQAGGLIGAEGILPLDRFVEALEFQLGTSRYWRAPMLFYFNDSDAAVLGVCLAGVACSVFVLFNIAVRPCLALLFVFYLSLFYAGQTFMSFQWDILLLEAGFLAALLPWQPRLAMWLFRLLLFRFMFLSGAVKLLSGDPAWATLTALNYHYETQPLPAPLAWYAHHLPEAVHHASVALTFFIELVVPFFFFAPWRLRFWAAALTVGLEIVILLTGNYNFFNILTIALCLFLLDDRALRRVWPRFLTPRGPPMAAAPGAVARRLVPGIAVVLVVNGATLMWMEFTHRRPVAPAYALVRLTAPLHIVNTYGLFRVMTTERPEIVIQGSRDGTTWQDYAFRYKPGDLSRAPRNNIPHQPRLDWQMWFAALGSYERNPWFANFMVRLLQDADEVTALLAHNPFADEPPLYIQAVLYDYRFAKPEERAASGQWWTRESRGLYMPPIRLHGSDEAQFR